MKKSLIIFIFMISLKINNINSAVNGIFFKYIVHEKILEQNVPELKDFKLKYLSVFDLAGQERQNKIQEVKAFGQQIIEKQKNRLAVESDLTESQKESIKYVIASIESKLQRLN